MVHPSTCFKNVKLIMKAFPGVNLSNKRLKSNSEHNIALFSVYISYGIRYICIFRLFSELEYLREATPHFNKKYSLFNFDRPCQ